MEGIVLDRKEGDGYMCICLLVPFADDFLVFCKKIILKRHLSRLSGLALFVEVGVLRG